MALHNLLGKQGEQIAVDHLIHNGYNILQRNWRYKMYEIDIIAIKNNILIIVEVKTRATNKFGNPESFVSIRKQKYLTKAANEFIKIGNIELEIQFDIISIILQRKSNIVNHIENAFYPLL